MGVLETIGNLVPGWRTLEGIGKGAGRLLKGDFKGALSAVGKGLTNDWGLMAVTLAIPGLNMAAAGRLAFLGVNAARGAKAASILANPAVKAAMPLASKAGIAQLGAVTGDMLGLFGKEGEGTARQQESVQHAGQRYQQQPIQGPNISW